MASTPRAHSGGLLFSVTALLVQATPIAAFEHHQQRLFPCFDDTNPPQSKRLGTNTYGGPLGMGLCPTRVQWPGRPRPHRFQPSHRNGFRRRVQLAYLHHKQVRRDRVPSQTGRKPLHKRESAGAGTRFSGDGTQNPASGYRSGSDQVPTRCQHHCFGPPCGGATFPTHRQPSGSSSPSRAFPIRAKRAFRVWRRMPSRSANTAVVIAPSGEIGSPVRTGGATRSGVDRVTRVGVA